MFNRINSWLRNKMWSYRRKCSIIQSSPSTLVSLLHSQFTQASSSSQSRLFFLVSSLNDWAHRLTNQATLAQVISTLLKPSSFSLVLEGIVFFCWIEHQSLLCFKCHFSLIHMQIQSLIGWHQMERACSHRISDKIDSRKEILWY